MKTYRTIILPAVLYGCETWSLTLREECRLRVLLNIKMKTYRTIILPVVLYGCETWSLTLREECRLGMFMNRSLRKIFGPKRDEVIGESRKLHTEELNDMYPLPRIVRVIKSRRMRWLGRVTCMGKRRCVHRASVGKPEGKRPLGRPRHIWEDNIKRDPKEVGCGGMDRIDLAQDRTGDGHLSMRYWTFGFHKMRGISWLAENQLASQGLYSME